MEIVKIIEILKDFSNILNDFLMGLGIWAPILSSVLIVLEGIFAFLPLVVFVTINILTLGPIIGCIISWLLTTIGSFLAFYLCRKGLSGFFQKKFSKGKLSKFMKKVDNLKFKQLVLIIAIPFAPSFFINVGAGLSNISIKKYFYALFIGKIFVILFLGYIGCNLVECLTNPLVLIKVILLIVIAYIVAQIVNKKFDLDERF